MKSQDIRQSFLDFFQKNDHRLVPSAPIVAHGDPTLLFVNAGMVPFKDHFLGNEPPPSPRVMSVQRCLRVSGKHNDLENVGPSPRHHTFFEMLGNFSFGDYFKEHAIELAWELVTGIWELPPERLFATVFEDDDEAEELWLKISGLPRDRVLRCGAADNFWAMGETGPCGPSSEIFVDLEPEKPRVDWREGSDSGRYLEIWNLVFMQYERDASRELEPLPNPSIDTGAGLERIAAVLQGVKSNYESDLFLPLLHAAAELASTRYGQAAEGDVSLRVVADHLRSTSFLLADGVIPGPDGRGYVLRRLLRRAVRHGQRIGLEEPFLHRLVPTLVEVLGTAYPELEATREATEATLRGEEEKYLATQAAGSRHIQEAIDRARGKGLDKLSGEDLFRLYDTYGQELDAVREIAEEEQLGLDEEGFEHLLEERRKKAREVTSEHQERLASLRKALYAGGEPGETPFEGYDRLAVEAEVVGLAAQNGSASAAETLEAGRRGVAILDRTVFYAEGGGQVGDVGELHWEGGTARVTDTQKDPSGAIYHFLEVEEGELASGQGVALEVDAERRRAVERNHTATHLLHAALRKVLGEGVRQAGSLVAPDRLRFDFTFGRPLTPEELRAIEDEVNHWVRGAVGTEIAWRGHREAIEAGAMALFGEKYGEQVRTVEVPGTSLELCGGCHVRNSGEIGLLLVTSERGVASGVRRIEAVTGEGAFELVRQRQGWLEALEGELGVPAERMVGEVEGLKDNVRELERELAKLRMQLVSGSAAADDAPVEVAGIEVVAREVPSAPTAELRNMADALRDKLGSGVVVLGASDGEKVTLIAAVTKDLAGRLHAGKLVGRLAPIVGGKGGGRPDFAQAGGRDPAKLGELLEAVAGMVKDDLSEG